MVIPIPDSDSDIEDHQCLDICPEKDDIRYTKAEGKLKVEAREANDAELPPPAAASPGFGSDTDDVWSPAFSLTFSDIILDRRISNAT